MTTSQIRDRVSYMLDGLLANWRYRLPFRGRYLDAVRIAIMRTIGSAEAQWRAILEGASQSEIDQFIDWLIEQISQSMALPPWLALLLWPLRSQLLAEMRGHLRRYLEVAIRESADMPDGDIQ